MYILYLNGALQILFFDELFEFSFKNVYVIMCFNQKRGRILKVLNMQQFFLSLHYQLDYLPSPISSTKNAHSSLPKPSQK